VEKNARGRVAADQSTRWPRSRSLALKAAPPPRPFSDFLPPPLPAPGRRHGCLTEKGRRRLLTRRHVRHRARNWTLLDLTILSVSAEKTISASRPNQKLLWTCEGIPMTATRLDLRICLVGEKLLFWYCSLLLDK